MNRNSNNKFYFGASISSHQSEGRNYNDWTEWEKLNAVNLADYAPKLYKKLASWPKIKDAATDPENYLSGIAIDHYRLYEEDFDMAREIGLNSFRFSVEWSRIEPIQGEFDETEINHYKNYIRELRSRGLEPFLTVWHWTLPVWLSEKGGILSKDFPELFERYAKKLAESFGDSVKFWVTINEPENYSLNGYYRGIWPPEKSGIFSYLSARKSLLKAHRKAFFGIKEKVADALIGQAHDFNYFESAGSKFDNFLKYLADKFYNYYFLNKSKKYADFIGTNYYFHNRIDGWFYKNRNEIVSDMGWELYPEGLKSLLLELKRYDKPIYILENGLADMDDKNRAWYIEGIMMQVKNAIRLGVNIEGYFHWSLLDNFEWDKGFWPRFGLIEVERPSLMRKIRKSAFRYKELIESFYK